MAISIFMKIESETDGAVEGSHKNPVGDEGMMEVFELDGRVYIPKDDVTGQIMGSRRHADLVVNKVTDKATPTLYKHLCTGSRLTSVLLEFYEVSPAGVEELYFTCEMKKARITEIQPKLANSRHAHFESVPHHELVKFSYEEITWTHVATHIEYSDFYKAEA